MVRQLRAILSADAVGYSRLIRDDEEATIRTITAHRKAIADLVLQYRGRVVDSPGDNLLAEFNSVVDAVNCAVEIQRELAERNQELSERRRMEFRIGLNLGDVVQEGDRIYGDGLNIAARSSGLAIQPLFDLSIVVVIYHAARVFLSAQQHAAPAAGRFAKMNRLCFAR